MPNLYTSPVGQPGSTPPATPPATPGISLGGLWDSLVGKFQPGQAAQATGWDRLYNTPQPQDAYQHRFPDVQAAAPGADQVPVPQAAYHPNVSLIPDLTGSNAAGPLQAGAPAAVQRIMGSGAPTPLMTGHAAPDQHAQQATQATRVAQAPQYQPVTAGPVQTRWGEPVDTARTITNGGTSQSVGGYGDQSVASAWAHARLHGLASPAAYMQQTALAKTMAARNSPEYQNTYQTVLQRTGNPALASAQADALFASEVPNYAGDFINSGQDADTQARMDQGLARLNAQSMVNPTAGAPVYASDLPAWGAYASAPGVASFPNGADVNTPVGINPTMLTQLTGVQPTGKAAAGMQITPYQQAQLSLAQQRNQYSQIGALNSQYGTLNSELNSLQKNGGDPARAQQVTAQMNAIRSTLNQLTGIQTPAQPVVINTNAGK